MHPASSSDKHFSSEKTYHDGGSESQVLTKMSSTITHSSTTSTKKEFLSTVTSTLSQSGKEPTSVCTKATVQSSEQSTSDNGAPPVVQSHKIEEYEKIIQDRPGEVRQEKTVLVSEETDGLKRDVKTSQVQKPSRKPVAPRFVSPITGMIVDQGEDIVFEGIIDGFPQPTVQWSKNGQELTLKENVKISYAHNHVKLELKNVNVKDAGRYTCTVNNDVGNASSTADLVVKKTIFPPVFGKRLKAQVAKKGDRVVMEVEITGIPEPTVGWYKNDVPINERPPELRITQQGNCYILLIDKVKEEDAGKYMVRATNAGGEAQSIADVAVFEPKPDTMVEVHKTVVYENIQDKSAVQSAEKKEEVSSGILTSEQTPVIQPLFKPITTLASTTIDTYQKIDRPEIKASKSEKFSSVIESHETETKTEQKFHMKLEHKTPSIVESKSRSEQTIAIKEADVSKPLIKAEEKSAIENENIETSTIAKKDALSFFESITKESEALPKGPKEMIKLTEEGQVQEAKVGKLTKNYEQATFQEIKKSTEAKPPEFQATKKAVQDIFTKLEQGSSPRGVDNKLFEFPIYESPKPTEIKKTTLEERIISDSSILQTESSETLMKSFNLVPEPPPEICYMPKPEEAKKKRPDVFVKAKQLQESFDKTISPIEAPIGGVKIFPTSTPKISEPVKPAEPIFSIPPPFELEKKEAFEETSIKKDAYEKRESKYFKEEKTEPFKYSSVSSTSILRSTSPSRPWSSSSDVETKSHVSTDLSEYRCHSAASSGHQEVLRATSPKPSADALAMEKSWAKKYAQESNRKSWPPQATESAQKWNVPVDEYKSSSREFTRKVEETPEGDIKKISTESSANVERRSWSSKEEFTEKIVEGPSATKLGPIIYNAETIKVDHTVNTLQEKALFEKYLSECKVDKTESTRKFEEFISKRLTEDTELKAPSLVKELKAPALVRKIEPVVKSEVDSLVLQPGSPPEIGYIPPFAVKEEEPPVLPPKDVRITPPPLPAKKPVKLSTVPSKFVKGSYSHESDYESDFEGRLRAKWRPYESDNEEPHYRRVKAPVAKQPTRPKSTEPEPLPPSKFETPALFTGPTRPLAAAELSSSEKAVRKTTFKRHEREFKQQQTSTPLRPGSPPIYVQPKPPSVKKPESPKFKTKVFQQESGYMADTDEPFQQKASSMTSSTTQKSFGRRDGSSTIVHTESTESRMKSFESHSYQSDHVRKEESSFVSSPVCTKQTAAKVVDQQEKSYSSTTSSGLRRFESFKETGHSMDQSHRKLEPVEKILPISPSPSKFVKGEFRESDYESDYDRRTPPYRASSSTKFSVVDSDIASRHMSDMTSSFKSKTEKFVSDIQSDLRQSKPILKHPVGSRTTDSDEPRTYREESRVSEHGTKQIDPDTGLIYFKYDFGYEFGIILPGEGKKTVESSQKSIQGQRRRASDIDVPIVHEFTEKKANGFAKKKDTFLSRQSKQPGGSKFGGSKTVKWEPTSESEFSEAEDTRHLSKKQAEASSMMTPPSLIIPSSVSPSRWDRITPSPLSLSPSLPSLSPKHSSATGPPSNVDSAGSPWPTSNGVSSAKEVIQPYLDILPKKAPTFITPLKDIAVVSGQPARFECIVQAEPQPNILWSKDCRIVENSASYDIQYRNGVCRLTVIKAFPEDAGTYACTATNSLGSTSTSANLEVPGNRRSIYAPIS